MKMGVVDFSFHMRLCLPLPVYRYFLWRFLWDNFRRSAPWEVTNASHFSKVSYFFTVGSTKYYKKIKLGIGYTMVFYSVIVGIYYNMIIAYAIFYFFSSLTAKLPWEGCDSFWTLSEDDFRNNLTVRNL